MGEPIPMVLHCPECKTRHIDEGEFATKPHHTHSCQKCGLTWRPAVVKTVGVRFLPGFKNDDDLEASRRETANALRSIADEIERGEWADWKMRATSLQRKVEGFPWERHASVQFAPDGWSIQLEIRGPMAARSGAAAKDRT